MNPIHKKILSKGCTCSTCIEMCNRPCWPTPPEAKALIESEFKDRLMLDYWVRYINHNYDPIYIIGPACVGYENDYAPNWPDDEPCTFLENERCQLHEPELKPYEGRIALCSLKQPDLHEQVAMMWDCDKGREVVEMWKRRNG